MEYYYEKKSSMRNDNIIEEKAVKKLKNIIKVIIYLFDF